MSALPDKNNMISKQTANTVRTWGLYTVAKLQRNLDNDPNTTECDASGISVLNSYYLLMRLKCFNTSLH